jgi:outer membrane protein assembly factor BamB
LHALMRRWLAVMAAVLLLLFALVACVPGEATDPGWTVVAATQDRVYTVLPTGLVAALDADTGDVIWQYPPPGERSGLGQLFSGGSEDQAMPLQAVYGIPTLVDDLVVVGTYAGKLYAFEADTGLRRWEIQISDDAIIGGVAAYEGVLYFGSADNRVMAIDLLTGEPIWPAPVETGDRVWGRPAVDDERVYVGSMDHAAYGLDRQSGTVVWRTDVGGAIPGDVSLADGAVIVGCLNKQIHALDAESGTELWASPAGAWVWGEALVTEGVAYVGDLDGRLHAVSLGDGTPVWDRDVQLDGTVRAGPELYDGSLVVGTESGTLYLVDRASGQAEVLYEREGAILSSPAVAGDRIYVGTNAGEVIALEMTDRGPWELWVYPPPKE